LNGQTVGAAMYDPRLGLARSPFDDVADPDMLYPGVFHQSAHSELVSAVKTREGLVVLVGEPGTGKTTLLRRVVRDLELAGVPVLSCAASDTFDEMVTSLSRRLNVPNPGTAPDRLTALIAHVTRRAQMGNWVVVAVDDAHRLTEDDLGSLRTLTETASSRGAPLPILLVGRPVLDLTLARLCAGPLEPALAARVTLPRLPHSELEDYVGHRLHRAGCRRAEVFRPEAINRLAFYTDGTPRLVNRVCDQALRLAHETGELTVSVGALIEAARSLGLERLPSGSPRAPEGALEPPEPPPTRWSELGRSIRDSVRPRLAWAMLLLTSVLLLVALRMLQTAAPPAPSPGVERAGAGTTAPGRQEAWSEASGRPAAGNRGRAADVLRLEGIRGAPESVESPAPIMPPIPSSPLSAASALAVRTTPVLPPPPSVLGPPPRERALLSAAEAGDLGEVRRLFAAGVSPHARGDHGLTALMAAVANNHVETALALIDRGADVNARDSRGLTPLMIAASTNRPTLLRVLLARGADVNANTEEGWTPLIYAAWQGHAYLALQLLEAGADPAAVDKTGWTALEYAKWRAAHRDEPRVGEGSSPDPAAEAHFRELVVRLGEMERRR
jgi:type II secretory pathway predicted ATPase ExeA